MEHGHLVDTYNRAQQLFYKKKYRRAKKLFEIITSEIFTSDTDCVADMHLCDSSQEYLDEINDLKLINNWIYWVILGIIFIAVLIYFIVK